MEASIAWTGPLHPMDPAVAGQLRCILPEEMLAAFLLAIDRDRYLERRTMAAWKRIVLSTTCKFIKCDRTETIFGLAANIRESIGAAYETMYPTCAGDLLLEEFPLISVMLKCAAQIRGQAS